MQTVFGHLKLSQYADDTTLTLDGSEQSLDESLRLLDIFESMSGLRLSKTLAGKKNLNGRKKK